VAVAAQNVYRMAMSKFAYIDFARIPLAFLTLALAVAACSGPDATPTPKTFLPTATPTATATPTPMPPTATPTPRPPSADVALANARAAVAELDAYRFTLEVTRGNVAQMEVAGVWVAPGFYDASVLLPVCPPAVPGAPAPTDCLLLTTYQEIKSQGTAYSRSSTLTDGQWEIGSDLARYDLGFLNEGISPAQHLLSTVDVGGDIVVSETMVGAVQAYQIVARPGPGKTTWLRVKRDSNELLSVAVVDGGTTQEWTFTSHDEALAVEPPALPATHPPVAIEDRNPVRWLAAKTIRLVENDPRFATTSLRPFVSSDAPIVNALIDALSTGTVLPKGDFQITGRVVTLHFTDGTRFQLMQAADKATREPIADHWFIVADSSVVVRSADITGWWGGIDDHFTPVGAVTWPGSVVVDKTARFSGQGWPDEIVILSTVINERRVEFGEARTTMGAWEWEGDLPNTIRPGVIEINVNGAQPGTFVHRPETKEIIVRWPSGFAIDGRQARVVYATDGTSSLPTGAPLWSGKPEQRDSLRKLLATINDAPNAQAPTTEINRNHALHIGHPEGSETLLHFAGACGVLTETTVCSDNRWAVSHVDQVGTQISPVRYIDSSDLSGWWRQRARTMPHVESLSIPDEVRSHIQISGDGWPIGESVTIQITSRGEVLVNDRVDLNFGSFSIHIAHLAPLPGALEVTVMRQRGNGPSVTRSTQYR
jgi:hypothetical protein